MPQSSPCLANNLAGPSDLRSLLCKASQRDRDVVAQLFYRGLLGSVGFSPPANLAESDTATSMVESCLHRRHALPRGDIHIGTNVQTNDEVAIKLEKLTTKQPQVLYESKVYKIISGHPGIPEVHWYGVEGDYNVMVLDLLGPSLEDLFNFCGRKFSLKTVLMLADQMFGLMEHVHSRNLIHRDIKPDNFLMGVGKNDKQLYMIDFGLAKKYRNASTQEHIAFREHKSLTGTARYASIHTHLGEEQSRRDDMEAIAYVLLYFMRGGLPWQGLRGATKEEKYKKILEKKLSIPIEALGKAFPTEFTTYLNYSQNLGFEDRPNYAFPRMLLRDLFDREKLTHDSVFDWDIRNEQEKEEQAARYGAGAGEVELAVRLRERAGS
ncbi:unnamed protein product [Prorocentrum cordatum]|uniref:Casein kinase I n=1 Tax=Prorocentrum cordatum TaxID=2364126 RepID=A0ABN9VHG4_9DINO|nr:unnamed protein product [Polarella glacialis]